MIRQQTGILLVLAILLHGVAHSVERTEERKYGDVQEGKALVYLIYPGPAYSSSRATFVFLDDQPVAILTSGAYTFGHVEPGRYLLHAAGVREYVDLFPGKTHYFELREKLRVLSENAGKSAIEELPYAVSSESEQSKASKVAEKKYEKAKLKHDEQDDFHVEEVAVAAEPEDKSGLIVLPAYSEITLTLTENFTSFYRNPGDPVGYEVTNDILVGDAVAVKRGTAVTGVVSEQDLSSGVGQEGSIEVTVPSVPAIDGSKIPITGSLSSVGIDKAGKASGAFAAVGILGMLLVKGREAFHTIGEEFTVRTRGNVWVNPTNPIEAEADGSSVLSVGETQPGEVKKRVTLALNTRKKPKSFDVDFIHDAPVTDAEIVFVGDRQVQPIPITGLKQKKEKVRAQFSVWDIVRFYPVERVTKEIEIPVTIQVATETGDSFYVGATVPVFLKIKS